MRNTNQYIPVGDSVVILLRNGKQILVDPESVELLSRYTWCITGTGYAMSRTTGPATLMHRLLAGAKDEEYVDHINGDTLDNRITNLRLCRKQQNEFNTKIRSDNKSGYRGVCASKRGKYRAYIVRDGKQYSLGEFSKPADAARAYNEKAIELFGEFARLNQI